MRARTSLLLCCRGNRLVRKCELGYLSSQAVGQVDITPRMTRELPTASQSFAQSALATRVARVLEEDYFLGVDVRFGTISGGLPLLVTDTNRPVAIYLDPDSTSVAPLLVLYRDDFNAFARFVKDFVRSAVFPRVAKLVPSSTREGSEAFLRHLRANRELFEYELDDKADLEEIFEELRAGRLTIVEATKRLTDTGRPVVEVSSAGTAPLSSVVKEIVDDTGDDDHPDSFDPRPAIDRREEETGARILTSGSPVNGYTCFLSLSDRIQREKGDFFLQPHSAGDSVGRPEGHFHIPASLGPFRPVLRHPLSWTRWCSVWRWTKDYVDYSDE